jgi:hypothetical protein
MKYLIITLFVLCAFIAAIASSIVADYKLYAKTRLANGSIVNSYLKIGTDSIFNVSEVFISYSVEHFEGKFEPELPNNFANYTKGADGIYRNYVPYADEVTAVEWTGILNKPSTFDPSTHSHAISDVTGAQDAIDAKASLVSPTFTTPDIGVASGTSLSVTGNLTSSGGSIGYTSGNGGTVNQTGNKGNAVTLHKLSGQITMAGSALAAAAEVSFTLNNSNITSTDVVYANIQSVGTVGSYTITVSAVGNGSCSITIGNVSTGSLSQALVINFIVLKAVNN